MSSYQTWHNQIIHVTQYFFTYGLLTVLIPRLIFKQQRGDRMEQAIINYCKLMILLILLGYLLVLVKLFEMITILLILGLMAIGKYMRRRSATTEDEQVKYYVQTLFYNFLDGQIPVKAAIAAWIKGKYADLKQEVTKYLRVPSLIRLSLLAMVISVAAYLRFYDAVTSSPPAFSDGYVTLAWFKYINGRHLFHDGIYPQGFHIFMATLSKFTTIDALYILKYTGPFNGVLTVLGLYFALSKMTGRYAAGLLAAIVYGWAGYYFSQNGWERQAATNSQEFAFVFLFPALYFTFQYLNSKDALSLRNAGICIAISGLVHSFAYAYTMMSVFIMVVVFFLTDPRGEWKSCRNVFVICIATGLLASLPLGLGLLIGRGFHSSSARYLVSQVQDIVIPELRLLDYLGVVSILLVGAWALLYAIFDRGSKREVRFGLFTFLFGATSFVLYVFVGLWTGSEIIGSRSNELWAFAASFGLGAAWHMTIRFPARWFRFRNGLDWMACLLLPAFVLLVLKPSPIITYKLEWGSSVEKYLQISGKHRPNTWMIVAQEEQYPIILGNGFHMYVRDLLQTYDPEKSYLTKRNETKSDPDLPNDVFIFREKVVFKVSRSNSIYPLLEETYHRREKEMAELKMWLNIHQATQQDMTLYYEDDHLEVYRLHREMIREQMNRILWGDDGKGGM
ncbi:MULTISPECIES: hypothetical protein [unclassified Paenibacillus]|uniref:hypothetical protein n=1 Tax=unclassified Paenibacillus TaxID=185978 RepID=UPI001AE9515F|nr:MULTISPECIES: hypothetical protein [unclassified Paenibacillus]MBP1154243.1 hypothetical protein [Paenibacillus sp. PvP091]MBP1170372.1 hypothetical protein [Paenibacillus sp. PvR098]MBP2441400.1 hypothetical protein [Paenibacillus sp. PvP052]